MRAKIKVNGIVQGVGFRPFVYRLAVSRGLVGYVCNLGDAGVEIEVQGAKSVITKFAKELSLQKPPLAAIDVIEVSFENTEANYTSFEIQKSKTAMGGSASALPPDIAICDECLKDMASSNRRNNYFFTTCTNCGPRFTVIKALPYDRWNTTMDDFDMCDVCADEYANPLDRRYHAQTIACNWCGPKLFLNEGDQTVEGFKAAYRAADLLNKGKIVAVKGVGGYHVACLSDEMPVRRLRELLGRKQKPFAVMVRDKHMLDQIAYADSHELELLSSYQRPIVLLKKKSELPGISPGLHTYGIMFPYTGLHHLLFERVQSPLVMSSANLPGKPIIYREDEIQTIGADALLYYNRSIIQRCDDSITKLVDSHPLFIRRSRGFVPLGVHVPHMSSNILGLGAEENVTACLLTQGHAFLSQHIGHVTNPKTVEFLEASVRHLQSLFDFHPDIMTCDLHPQFLTTQLAHEWAESYNIPVVQVQHHHAHVAKVMFEHAIDSTVGIAIDGFGYGSDKQAWGGEILVLDDDDMKREGHLAYYPLLGGDRATKYPLRLLAGILGEDIADFLFERASHFPYKEDEVETLLSQLRKNNILTSSCGRLLDAVASLLDIVYVMDYEGEPAMKLEAVASCGTDILALDPVITQNIINTEVLLRAIYDNLDKNKKDLAFSAQEYIAKSFATVAIDTAYKTGIETVAVAGGCSYNEHIIRSIKTLVEKADLKFLINRLVPCGDGGISYGQVAVANKKKGE